MILSDRCFTIFFGVVETTNRLNRQITHIHHQGWMVHDSAPKNPPAQPAKTRKKHPFLTNRTISRVGSPGVKALEHEVGKGWEGDIGSQLWLLKLASLGFL
jgi:hypothetical protein